MVVRRIKQASAGTYMSEPLAADRPRLAAMWAELADIQARFVKQQTAFAAYYTTMNIAVEQLQNLQAQCAALSAVGKKHRGCSVDGDRRMDAAEEKLLSDLDAFRVQLATFYNAAGVEYTAAGVE